MKEETVETHEPYGETGIGEDTPQVQPKLVVVEEYRIDEVFKDEKLIGKKVVLSVRHPDITDRQIEISGAKYEFGKNIKIAGLWWKEDPKGKIPYNSALAHVLRHYNAKNLIEMRGKQVQTVTDDNNYLVVKAY